MVSMGLGSGLGTFPFHLSIFLIATVSGVYLAESLSERCWQCRLAPQGGRDTARVRSRPQQRCRPRAPPRPCQRATAAPRRAPPGARDTLQEPGDGQQLMCLSFPSHNLQINLPPAQAGL